MATTLPPLPLKVPVVDSDSLISGIWQNWLVAAFSRMGGLRAPSNTELAEGVDLSALQGAVATLQSDVSGLQGATVTLSQDPVA